MLNSMLNNLKLSCVVVVAAICFISCSEKGFPPSGGILAVRLVNLDSIEMECYFRNEKTPNAVYVVEGLPNFETARIYNEEGANPVHVLEQVYSTHINIIWQAKWVNEQTTQYNIFARNAIRPGVAQNYKLGPITELTQPGYSTKLHVVLDYNSPYSTLDIYAAN
jgi:hypothetical protein